LIAIFCLIIDISNLKKRKKTTVLDEEAVKEHPVVSSPKEVKDKGRGHKDYMTGGVLLL